MAARRWSWGTNHFRIRIHWRWRPGVRRSGGKHLWGRRLRSLSLRQTLRDGDPGRRRRRRWRLWFHKHVIWWRGSRGAGQRLCKQVLREGLCRRHACRARLRGPGAVDPRAGRVWAGLPRRRLSAELLLLLLFALHLLQLLGGFHFRLLLAFLAHLLLKQERKHSHVAKEEYSCRRAGGNSNRKFV